MTVDLRAAVGVSLGAHVALTLFFGSLERDRQALSTEGGDDDDVFEVALLSELENSEATDPPAVLDSAIADPAVQGTDIADPVVRDSRIADPVQDTRVADPATSPDSVATSPSALAMRGQQRPTLATDPRPVDTRTPTPVPGTAGYGIDTMKPPPPKKKGPPGLTLAPPPKVPNFGKVKPQSELRPNGGGTARTDDGPYVAHTGRDGRVNLKDKPNFWIKIALPKPKQVGRGLARWAEDPYGHAGAKSKKKKYNDEHADEATPGLERRDVDVPIFGGGFDLTDWAMRGSGQDPYAHKKLAFLDRTRDERAGMAMNARSEDLRTAVASARKNLLRLWRHSSWSVSRRKRAIFDLWDEVAETGPAEVVQAGREIRATIVGFVRRHLSRGSKDGYTDAELGSLNKTRSSKARFAPYGVSKSPPRDPGSF